MHHVHAIIGRVSPNFLLMLISRLGLHLSVGLDPFSLDVKELGNAMTSLMFESCKEKERSPSKTSKINL